ncbi:unnamed protein product [Allacma fusca]|uniref:Peptidase S1 domain-containing protein n=1 Tax=Allacma fusca TaxID=39272 RepID=A0A8J2P5Z9_9HEXA|nr:unnamed protein product [Allacma fusca]
MVVSIGNSYAFLEFPILFEIDGRVVGGMDANLGQFPYQVALARKSGSAFCGGSLITSMLVLTAAHCLRRPDKQPNQIVVISGNHKLGSPNPDEQIVDVSSIIVHEDYNYRNYLNDIAIILLAKEITLNTNTNTISLPTEGTQFQNSAIVSGWGYQAYRGTSTNILQYAKVELLNQQVCRRTYESRRRMDQIKIRKFWA